MCELMCCDGVSVLATKKPTSKFKTKTMTMTMTPKFSGYFVDKNVYMTKVLYNDPITVVWWSDGTITRNKCPKNLTYSPDAGLLFCIYKKLYGADNLSQLCKDWTLLEDEVPKNKYITLQDVRKKTITK